MARGADVLENHAPLAEVGGCQVLGREFRFPALDELLLLLGGNAQFTPDIGEFGAEIFVLEGTDLAGVESGEIGARNLSGFDLCKQRPSPGGAGDKHFDHAAALGGFELAVALGDELAERWVIELGKSAHRGGADRLVAEQGLADGAQVGRMVLDQGRERLLPPWRLEIPRECGVAQRTQRLRVPKKKAELEDGSSKFRIGSCCGEGAPRFWPCGSLSPLEGIANALEDRALHLDICLRSKGKQRVERRRVLLRLPGETARDPVEGLRPVASFGNAHQRQRIALAQRDQSVPDHRWQVVVASILPVGGECLAQLCTLSDRQALESRC